jgi:hypothetical protein
MRPQGILLYDGFVVCGGMSDRKRIGRRSCKLLPTLHDHTL